MKNNLPSSRARLSLLLLLLLLCACKQDRIGGAAAEATSANDPGLPAIADHPLLRLVPASESGVDFQNVVEETLVNNLVTNSNIFNGGGVGIADINNDELPDLYFVATTGKNRLYLNQGGMKFKDITDQAGVGCEGGMKTAVTFVDINNDGWLDFYVCRAGHPLPPEERADRLYINNGNLTFTEMAEAYGLADRSVSTGANFFDYDLDGDLDLFLLTSVTNNDYVNRIESSKDTATGIFSAVLKPKSPYDTDRMYRNEGNNRFVDVTQEAGLVNFGFGLSVTTTDFNGDGYPDLYIGNDYIHPDALYINNRNGTFTNRLAESVKHTTQHTMGVDLADFDNDARVDLVAVDMLPYTRKRQKATTNINSQSRYKTLMQYGYFEPMVRNLVQHNNGPTPLPDGRTGVTFSDIGCMAGVYKTDWSWSCLFFDIDNDSQKDLAITNGFRREVSDADFLTHTYPELQKTSKNTPFSSVEEINKHIPVYKLRNFVYRNKADWTFEEMSGQWLTSTPSWSCGAAYADLDADGDLDWVVNNIEEPAFVYENQSGGQPNHNFLQIKLKGAGKNTFAVGASAMLWAGGAMQYLELTPTRGIFSSVEHLLHFGLGSAQQVDSLLLRWPDGRLTRLQNLPANQRLTLDEKDAEAGRVAWLPGRVAPAAAAWKPDWNSGLDFKHTENIFDDFDVIFLQPWYLTELGPVLAKADVDGDGLEDVYIGNAFNSPGALYRQRPDGRFEAIASEVWKVDAVYEDLGAVFFDFDQDGDPDLFVVSGGQETKNEAAWQDRLYINLGSGRFARASNAAVPNLKHSGMRAVPFDYDGDGDLDLFVGGRVAAQAYPKTPRSGILRNDRNKLTDVTDEVGGDFTQCGMISDLAWVNIDTDPAAELVVVGEWMPVTVFKLQNGVLKKVDADLGFGYSNGFWNRLLAADLDGDGDQDLVTGNFGLNAHLSASVESPLRCFAKDFDKNGSLDPLLATYELGRLIPLRQKDPILKQLPELKKKYVYSKTYSEAAITDFYPERELESGQNLIVYTLASTWWENRGGKFVAHVLPLPAQVAPMLGIVVDDFNRDGRPDLFLVGNKYGVEVEIGRCDAGTGCLLLNNGQGGFTWMPNAQSGLWARREARDVAVLRGPAGKKTVVVANNNDRLEVYRQAQ